MTLDISHALVSLKPNASWVLVGTDYSGLQWNDESQTKPTEAEVQAELVRLQAQYDAKQYQRDRAKEYPDFKDYLDGIVKGDTAQVQAYIDACNAVKAKYPKG
jgi:hypothetical protein